jgi:chromosome segregation ATPase
VQELLGHIDEQGRFLAEREYTSDTLRSEASSASKTVSDLRAELAEAEARRRSGIESLQTEREVLENQLRQSHLEKGRLQEEIAAMKREVESTWVNERMENAVLRERINDVAAEVARLTSVLEGPGSQIDAILAGEAGRTSAVPLAPAAGNAVDNPYGAVTALGEGVKGSLADRIRALQGRSARVPEPSRA